MILDFTFFSLLSTNVVQMIIITWFLLPIDTIALTKSIRNIIDYLHNSGWFCFMVGGYIVVVVGLGIIAPTKILNSGRIPKFVRDSETPSEKIKRITNSTNAARNYLLAGFSLFYLLVLWRLIEYLEFSAKLHEFSNLMGNYDLVDIGEAAKEKEEEEIAEEEKVEEAIEEEEDDEEPFVIGTGKSKDYHWPSVANLNRKEESRIKQFFIRTPKRGRSRVSLSILNQESEESATQNQEAKTDTNKEQQTTGKEKSKNKDKKKRNTD